MNSDSLPCLICYKNCAPLSTLSNLNSVKIGNSDNDGFDFENCASSQFQNENEGRGRMAQNQVSKQLHVIFILRKLLEIPSSTLEQCFDLTGGDNPGGWGIQICDECGGMVRRAGEIFEEIVHASRKFKEVQEQVVQKIQQSATEVHPDSWTVQWVDKENFGVKVTDKCRDFVSKKIYGYFHDPFISGDMEAGKVAREQRFRSTIIEADHLKTEVDDDDLLSDFQSSPEALSHSKDESDDPSFKAVKVKRPYKKRKLRKTITKLLQEEGAYLGPEGKILFRCDFEGCSKVFKNKRSYKRHKIIHTTCPISLNCTECGGSFGSQLGLNLHLKTIHQIIPSIPEVPNPTRIKKQRNRSERLKCPHCDLQINRFRLKCHIDQVHNKSYLYNCELCGKRERGLWEFRYHQAFAHHICSVEECKITCENRQSLRAHQLELHGKEIDVFGCDECDKLYVSRRLLRTHKLVHQNHKFVEETGEEGKFICDLCGKRFVIQNYLQYHGWSTHRKARKHKSGQQI